MMMFGVPVVVSINKFYTDHDEEIDALKKVVEKVAIHQDLNEREKYISKKNNKISKNYIKLFLVIIITFVAIIILLDTFKLYILNFIPQIDTILNNLYETLKDMYLFFEDLIR